MGTGSLLEATSLNRQTLPPYSPQLPMSPLLGVGLLEPPPDAYWDFGQLDLVQGLLCTVPVPMSSCVYGFGYLYGSTKHLEEHTS